MKLGMCIFMLLCNLIVPVTMILLGRLFTKNPPKEISAAFGYRTNRSMKNQDTWDFAQRYMGEIWYKVGWALVLFAVLGQALTLLAPTMGAMCMWSLVPTTVEIIVMLAAIIPVERALKQNFDENGVRRQA